MIPQTDLGWQEQSWQDALKTSVTDIDELCEMLQLDPSQLALSREAADQFTLKVPRSFVERMRKGDAADPLLLQVLNRREETSSASGGLLDPLEEHRFNPLPGLIHKYKNRVLLTVSGHCAIHCRYCFRRHFDYAANNAGSKNWSVIVDYLEKHPQVDEVIYSGGDPLSAPDSLLFKLTSTIRALPQIKRLRVHTRLPVVLPQRIDDSCLEWMRLFATPIIVLHINHAREIGADLKSAVSRMRSVGALVLNQSVLLADINDSAAAQIELQHACFDAGVSPYYLHMLDQVSGAMHFEVRPERAVAIYEEMRASLPGYLLPTLVRETPGDTAKTRVL